MRLKRFSTGAGVIVLTVASVVFTAGSASAAPAPSCVHLYQYETVNFPVYSKASAKNTCSSTKRFRFIWAWATDTECWTVRPGEWARSSRLGHAPYVSEVRAC